jgi:hypothetical protein
VVGKDKVTIRRKVMDERVKKLWVTALRSGEYTQGRGFLRELFDDKPRDCCLGVLCDLFAIENPTEGRWLTGRWLTDQLEGNAVTFQTRTDSSASELPAEVQEWAGLHSPNPDLGESTAAQWNDGEELLEGDKQATFSDIAEMVERYL